MSTCQKPSLLETLSQRAGCTYLSDLRLMPYRGFLPQVLPDIPPDTFTLWDWNDAVEYLLHVPAHFESGAQAKQFLLEHICTPPGYNRKRTL